VSPQQPDLFGETPPPPPTAKTPRPPARARVGAAASPPEIDALAQALQQRFKGRLHLGTSSWSFSGWRGLVWDDRAYAEADLSRHGLAAYVQHPLFTTVSLDRAFYRALDAPTYARLARQVPDGFRFVVKAPAEITDATLRMPESGAPLSANPHFLDPERTLDTAVRPTVLGLGAKFGVLVFQLPPLAGVWLRDPHALLDKLDALWRVVVPALPDGTRAALELRDPRALTPQLLAQLNAHGVRYCVGLHDRMPSMTDQLPMLRANWPGDLVCRWNLLQGLRYQQAKAKWAPFDRLQAPDPDTREALARAIVGTLAAGYRAFVTINNKAEGSAPLSVVELARTILRLSDSPNDDAP
jgi:uncharacterized protein YecE (DUF72 family)